MNGTGSPAAIFVAISGEPSRPASSRVGVCHEAASLGGSAPSPDSIAAPGSFSAILVLSPAGYA